MSCDRHSKEYINEAKEFIEFAAEHAENSNKIVCPCMSCLYGKHLRPLDLLGHLICHGIDPSYTRWTNHGETYEYSGGDRYLMLVALQMCLTQTCVMRAMILKKC